MAMKSRDVNFFQPLWRRIAVTAFCAIWAVIELVGRDQTWIFITLALTGYAVWSFFIRFPKQAPAAPAPTDEPGGSDAPPQA